MKKKIHRLFSGVLAAAMVLSAVQSPALAAGLAEQPASLESVQPITFENPLNDPAGKAAGKITIHYVSGDQVQDQTVDAGVPFALLPEDIFTPPSNDHGFTAWEINGREYKAGDTLTLDANTTVNAVWHKHDWMWVQNKTEHHKQCKICSQETSPESHRPSNWKNMGNDKVHWKECLDCKRELEKEPHQWQTIRTKDATCTEQGWTEVKCNVCGLVTRQNKTPALGHDMESLPEVPAACGTPGTKAHWHCKRCNGNYENKDGTGWLSDQALVIPALTHKLTAHPAKAATCTQAGSPAYWSCENCGKNFADENAQTELNQSQLVIQPLGHDMTHHEAVPATCEKDGTVEYWHCERCQLNFADGAGNTSITDIVDKATGSHQFGEWKQTTAPTCEVEGEETRTCSVCGATETRPVAALGHSYDEGVITKQPSCTERGEKTFTCSRCQNKKTEEIPFLSHQMTHVPAIYPTEEKPGNLEYWHCSLCNKNYLEEQGYHELLDVTDWLVAADTQRAATVICPLPADAAASEADKKAAQDLLGSLKPQDILANSESLDKLARELTAKNRLGRYDACVKLEDENNIIVPDGREPRILSQYYLEATLQKLAVQGEQKSVQWNIVPRYQMFLTIAKPGEAIVLQGENRNAVMIVNETMQQVGKVSLEIPLPAGFVKEGAAAAVTQRTADGSTHSYTANAALRDGRLCLPVESEFGLNEFTVQPAKPTEPPVQPTEKPTEPPVQPTEKPTEPPVQPTEKPTEPPAQPEGPAQPAKPTPAPQPEFDWQAVRAAIAGIKAGRYQKDVGREVAVPHYVWQAFFGRDVTVTFVRGGDKFVFNGLDLACTGFDPDNGHNLTDLTAYIGRSYANPNTQKPKPEPAPEPAETEEPKPTGTPEPTKAPEPAPTTTPEPAESAPTAEPNAESEAQPAETDASGFAWWIWLLIAAAAVLISFIVFLLVKSRKNQE